jgi:site-specific DNA recombinase
MKRKKPFESSPTEKNEDMKSQISKQNESGNLLKSSVMFIRGKDQDSIAKQQASVEEFANKNHYNIVKTFGLEPQSKDDNQKHLFKLRQFLKTHSKVKFILVWSFDRISRYPNSPSILGEMNKKGLKIISTIQDSTENPHGVFHENLMRLFSMYDSDVRKSRITSGMIASLKQGKWCFKVPEGYESIIRNKTKQIALNKKAKFVRKAFKMKANERLSNAEIAKYLLKKGYKISSGKLSKIFANPFYCGLISHSLLDGKIVRGKHPAIVSSALFLQINQKKN